MQSMAEPPKRSSTGGSPPAVANPPDGLPSDREMRVAELELPSDKPPIQLDSPLKPGDRNEDIERGREEEARRADEERARVKALKEWSDDFDKGESEDAPQNDLASPSVMAQYWELVKEDGIEPPKGQDHFTRWPAARAVLIKAFPVLNDQVHHELLRSLGIALMGVTRHVPLERFKTLVRQARAEQTADNMVREEFARAAAAPEPAPAQDAVTSNRSADDQQLLQGFAPSLSHKRGEWDVPTPTRPRGTGRRVEPAPIPAPAPTHAKRPERSPVTRRLVFAIAFLLISLIALSTAYLWQGQSKETVRNNTQDQTLLEHGVQLQELDRRTADVITALAHEKTQVITLTRERDSLQGLAGSFRDAMEADTREDARTRIDLTVKVNRVQDQLTATRREMERMREEMRAMGEQPAQETPSP